MKDRDDEDIITDTFTEYPLTYSTGSVSIDNIPEITAGRETGLGIQIATDGRVWICINGISFLRFVPNRKLNRGNG